MTDLDLDAITARADAATVGPWSARSTGLAGGDHWYICDDGEAIAYVSASDGENEEQREPDAEFIAHAREDVPALVAEVRALRAAAETSVPRARAVDLLASLIYQSDPSDVPVTMGHARRRAVYILDTRTREKNPE